MGYVVEVENFMLGVLDLLEYRLLQRFDFFGEVLAHVFVGVGKACVDILVDGGLAELYLRVELLVGVVELEADVSQRGHSLRHVLVVRHQLVHHVPQLVIQRHEALIQVLKAPSVLPKLVAYPRFHLAIKVDERAQGHPRFPMEFFVKIFPHSL